MSPWASLPTPESPQPPFPWRRILSWRWRSGLGSHPEWHCQLSRRRHLASRPGALHHSRALRVTAGEREGREPAAPREQGRAGSSQPIPAPGAPAGFPSSLIPPRAVPPGPVTRDPRAVTARPPRGQDSRREFRDGGCSGSALRPGGWRCWERKRRLGGEHMERWRNAARKEEAEEGNEGPKAPEGGLGTQIWEGARGRWGSWKSSRRA